MQTFLEEIAQQIVKNYEGHLDDLTLVFPNKRSGVFFRKYLSTASGKTTWSPDIYTIDRFANSLSGFFPADNLTLAFDLYESYKAIQIADNQTIDSFDSFFSIAEVLLNDFNEIDSYLLNVRTIFHNLRDIEEINSTFDSLTKQQQEVIKEFWRSFSPEKESEQKRRFMNLWNQIPRIYEHFQEHLLKKNYSYQGLSYKFLSEKIADSSLQLTNNQPVIFIGFNDLNKSQEQLFLYLKKTEQAHFYWDTDAYYHEDEKQEAGIYLRKNFKLLNIQEKIPANFTQKKEIEVYGVPLRVAQSKAASYFLEKYANKKKSWEKTALVLPDEQMLFPVLNAIPDWLSEVNVTMGYPFVQTPLYSLLTNFLNIQLAAQLSKNQTPLYYHQTIIQILQHPYVESIDKKLIQKILQDIVNQNLTYLPASFFGQYSLPILKLLFTPLTEGIALLSSILDILFLLYTEKRQFFDKGKRSLDEEYIYAAYTAINRYKVLIEDRVNLLEYQTAVKILSQLFSGLKIPFSGEPLGGIQLMGLLETRNLDFETVILFNMNEGIFPAANRPPSFIPESFRHNFSLPNLQHHDSVYAYYFYRLIQRAKRIIIFYNSIIESKQEKELSRYVQQLLLESPHKAIEKQLSQQISAQSTSTIRIEKSEAVLEKLSDYLIDKSKKQKALSASAINILMDCSLQFYFRYVVQLYKAEEIESDISLPVFGIILHAAMEELYKDFISQKADNKIVKEDFKELKKRIDSYIDRAFALQYKTDKDNKFNYSGSQLIVREVIKKYMNIVISYDEKIAPFEIFSLEEDKKSNFVGIPILLNEQNEQVAVKGIIDRVDKFQGNYRIIDYKTGKAHKLFKSVKSLFSEQSKNRNKIVLQSFIYTLLFKQNYPQHPNVYPIIYNVREMPQPDFLPHLHFKSLETPVNQTNINDFLSEFSDLLSKKLQEIFDSKIPFEQTEELAICRWCPYQKICGRD